MSNGVILVVGSKRLEGWTDLSITRSVDTLCGTFQLSMIDIWNLDDSIELTPGLPCIIYIGDERLITGYIDNQKPSVSTDASKISISGRCRTGDLVDCSAINVPGTWKDIGLRRICIALLNPDNNSFGISLITETDLGSSFKEFAITTGESVFEAISRACQDRAVVPLSNEKGDLVLTNIGKHPAYDDLIYGMNVVSADAEANYLDRFSEYQVKGQQSGKGKTWDKSMTQKFATSSDEYITRFRPKIITMDNETTQESAQKRANWEAQIRAGRSISVNVTLPSWYQSNGELWRENLIVYVSIPKLRVDGELLIREVSYKLNTSSRSLALKLCDPGIYATEPKAIIKKKKSRAGKWSFLSGA